MTIITILSYVPSIRLKCGYYIYVRSSYRYCHRSRKNTFHGIAKLDKCEYMSKWNVWVSAVNLHRAQLVLLTERLCFVDLVEHEGLHFYSIYFMGWLGRHLRSLSWKQSLLAISRAQISDRTTSANSTQMENKQIQPSSLLLYWLRPGSNLSVSSTQGYHFYYTDFICTGPEGSL